MQVPAEIQARGPLAVEIYTGCIERGESVMLAEMLALRQAPRGMTEDIFFEGIGTLDNQFKGAEGAAQLDRITSEAQKHGYRPGYNDYYCGQLASFPGDPDAFVPRTGGRSHVKKVLEKKGWSSVDGAVIVKGKEPDQDPHTVRVDLSKNKGKKKQ